MAAFLERAGAIVWGWPLMGLFLGIGLFFMVRLRGLPLRKLGSALRLSVRQDSTDGVSPYAALCTALAATIGTGNIVGVATALAAGGPGALFWMLIAAVFGMATQYAEGFLACKYRRRTKNGWFGGPFCYIEQGLGKRFRWLAKTYAAIGAAVGLLGVGTVTQVNSITSSVRTLANTQEGVNTQTAVIVAGALVTLASALVLLGGVKRIFEVCRTLVPFMSVVYVLCAGILLVRHADRLLPAVSLITRSAFCPEAVLGGGLGISLKLAMRMGIGRGVFTNEAGIGSSAIAAAASSERNPVRQGLVSMTGTFIDTIVICSMTGLCLVVTDAWNMPLEGVALTDYAWRVGLPWSGGLSSALLTGCLICFAFATIIGWNFYAERCFSYLVGEQPRLLRVYRVAYLLAIAAAPYFSVRAAWESADILNAVMALPNLAALLLLRKRVIFDTNRACSLEKRKNIM